MLSKFLHEGMITEVEIEGRKRTYCIREKGYKVLREEYT